MAYYTNKSTAKRSIGHAACISSAAQEAQLGQLVLYVSKVRELSLVKDPGSGHTTHETTLQFKANNSKLIQAVTSSDSLVACKVWSMLSRSLT